MLAICRKKLQSAGFIYLCIRRLIGYLLLKSWPVNIKELYITWLWLFFFLGFWYQIVCSLSDFANPDVEIITLSPKTFMATNRFVCELCYKDFQREQNLQFHRWGHYLPWKLRQRTTKEIRRSAYLCPEPTFVLHNPSTALRDLTGINKHFCRKHGEIWKAHSKTCGTGEYGCEWVLARLASFSCSCWLLSMMWEYTKPKPTC